MSMMDWMGAGQGPGPGPLDLTTPLAEGMRQGTAMAEQQEKVRSDYATEANMASMLGLEEKKQDLAQTMWDSQADMRAKDLQLKGIEVNSAAKAFGNTADDQGVLAGDQAAMHTMKPEQIDNFTGGDYKTNEGYTAFLNAKGKAMGTVLNQTQHEIDLATISSGVQAAKAQLDNMNYAKLYNIPIPTDSTGKPDQGALNLAVVADQNKRAVNLEQQKGAASPEMQAENKRADTLLSVAGVKASEYANVTNLKDATAVYNKQTQLIQTGISSGAISPTDAPAALQRAMDNYKNTIQNLQNVPTGQPTATPSSTMPTNPAQAVQSLFNGLPTSAPVTPASASSTPPPPLSAATWQTAPNAPASDPFKP